MARERKPTDLIQLKVRMTERMRASLEEEANRRGTSINAEVVHRLARSFDRQDLASEALELAFGREVAGLLLAVGLVMSATEQRGHIHGADEGAFWAEDPNAFEDVQDAVQTLLAAAAPTRPKGYLESPIKLGVQDALALIEALRAPVYQHHRRYANKARMIDSAQNLLGPLVNRMTKAIEKKGKK